MQNKDTIERACRRAGMKPVHRASFEGAEIFIADGFSAQPAIIFGRFGIDPGEFVGGCYATLWWVSRNEDKLDIGRPIFFELFHNPEFANGSKQVARINKALEDARSFLSSRKKASH